VRDWGTHTDTIDIAGTGKQIYFLMSKQSCLVHSECNPFNQKFRKSAMRANKCF